MAEWVVAKDGSGQTRGGSADQPADKKSRERAAAPAYTGLRIIRDSK